MKAYAQESSQDPRQIMIETLLWRARFVDVATGSFDAIVAFVGLTASVTSDQHGVLGYLFEGSETTVLDD